MPPSRSWHGLSLEEQRQVLRAARRREEHPRTEVADAAYRWAQDVLRPEQARRAGLIGGLLSLVADAAGGGWLGMAVAMPSGQAHPANKSSPTRVGAVLDVLAGLDSSLSGVRQPG